MNRFIVLVLPQVDKLPAQSHLGRQYNKRASVLQTTRREPGVKKGEATAFIA